MKYVKLYPVGFDCFLLLLIALNTFLFMEPWSSDDMFIAGKLLL